MKCVNCSNDAECKHHIVPKSKGGNVVVDLCNECHKKIHGGGVGSSYLTKLGLFKVQNAYFARLLYLIVEETTDINEIVKDFNLNGLDKVNAKTIKNWIRRMKEISTPDLFEILNPIMGMSKEHWDYFMEEWMEYCSIENPFS